MKARAILRPLRTNQHQGSIRRSRDSSRAADSVQRVVVLHLPEVVDDQNRQVVMVGKALEQRQVIVVTAVADIGGSSYLLQCIDDDQTGIVWLVRGKRMPADRVEDYPQYGEREDSRKEKRHDKRSA